MESGINARAIDYAKFGRLFLQGGHWDGQQIISEKWVKESTMPDVTENRENYYSNYDDWSFFHEDNGYYQYMWWGFERSDGQYDFFAYGKYGQVLYVSPQNNLIIVRLGKKEGKVDWWPEIMYQLSEGKGKSNSAFFFLFCVCARARI